MAKGKELTTTLKFVGIQDKSVQKTINSIAKGLGKMNSMVNKAIKRTALAASAVATTAAAAAVATTKALYDMGAGWDKASDTIRIGTGATGEQLEELNASMQNLYKQLPQGKDEIASTIADINTLTGASGDALEAYASNALKASRMLGVDVKSIYAEASKAFNAFNVPAEEMAGKLDHLFKVSQATGVGIDKLAQGAVMGQASFRTLGYSFEEATALLGQLDKAGVRSEAALAALKKGAVSLADKGAKDLPKAFAAVAKEIKNARSETEAINIAATVFGARGGGELARALRDGRMSAEAFTRSMKLSGESIDVAYQDTADFSEKMKPAMHTLEVAVKPLSDSVFQQINRLVPVVSGLVEKYAPIISAKAEELAKKVEGGMTTLITKLEAVDFDALLNDSANIAARVGNTLSDIWAHKDDIAKYAAAIMGVVAAIKAAKVAINTVQTAIKIITGLQWAWNIAMSANPIGIILLAIGALIAGIWIIYDDWDEICAKCQIIWEMTCDALEEAWDGCKSAWDATITWLGGAWNSVCGTCKSAWDATCSALEGAWDGCKSAWRTTISWLEEKWDGICGTCKGGWSATCDGIMSAWNTCKAGWDTTITWLENKWNTICGKLQGAWDNVKNGFMVAWDGMKAAAARAVDWLMDKIQPFLGVWDSVKSGVSWVANKIGLGDDETEKTAQAQKGVEKMATGGFTRGVTIAGEAGMEAIISFDPRYRAENQEYLRAAAAMLGMAVPGEPGEIRMGKQPVEREGRLAAVVRGVRQILDSLHFDPRPVGGAQEVAQGMAVPRGHDISSIERTERIVEVAGVVAGQPIQQLATGGFTRGVSIAGEAGTEAVISFDPRYRAANQGYLLTAAEMLGVTVPGAAGQANVAGEAGKEGGKFAELVRGLKKILGALRYEPGEVGAASDATVTRGDVLQRAVEPQIAREISAIKETERVTEVMVAAAGQQQQAIINPVAREITSLERTERVTEVAGAVAGQPIQQLATGGFTRGVSIAGEAGTEAVISFDPRYRTANRGYLLTAAEMLGMMAPVPAGGATTNHTTNIDLGGITFSPVIHAPTPASASNILDQLRAAVPDLADMLEEELARRAAHRYA